MKAAFSNTEITAILEAHQVWLNAEGGQRADFSDTNLEYANLQGANLQGANLTAANLSSADLQGANFIGAMLTGVTWI